MVIIFKLVIFAVASFAVVVGSPAHSGALHCAGVKIVSRSQWGAQAETWPLGGQYLDIPLYHVFISHTVTNECNNLVSCSQEVRNIQNYHRNSLAWGDIGYSFLIGGDGLAYEGRGMDKVGAHTINWNELSLGISFIGNYENKAPNNKMLNAARKLIDCAVDQGYLSPNYQLHGMRDATCTASPGQILYDIIKKWPKFVPGRLHMYSC